MMPADTLRYDPVNHAYFFCPSPGTNGISGPAKERWVPGVTRILSDLGYNKGAQFYTPASRQRGTALHYAVTLLDQLAPLATSLDHVLDVVDLDERLHGYVKGYLLFRAETGYTPQHSEFPVWSQQMQAAGTVDSWGSMGAKRVLLDLKSWRSQGAKPKRAAEIQTAGYALMAKECRGLQTDLRIVLKLPGDGLYRSYECVNPKDEMLFRSCASIWHDRSQAGLIEGMNQESEVELEA